MSISIERNLVKNHSSENLAKNFKIVQDNTIDLKGEVENV
jgi:hypothetical protein